MKLALALSVVMVSPAFAQQIAEPAPAAEQEAPAPKQPPQVDPEKVKAAEKILSESSKAYKDAKTLTDRLALEMQTPMGPQKQEMKLTFGQGNDAVVSFPGMTFTSLDGTLNITRDDVGDKYVKTKLEGSLSSAMSDVIGFVPPQAVMRYGGSAEEQLAAWTLEMIEDVRITGHEMITNEQGQSMHAVNVWGQTGSGAIHIDPETKLVEHVKLQFEPPGLPEGTKFDVTVETEPKVADALAEAIAFDAGERKAVESLDELEPTPIAIGEMAPDFTLPTLSGEEVTLSKLRGSVVVLDFWATWCGPCKMALPELQKFATWAESSGHPVKVYAVDVWERFESKEETKSKVSEFWTSKGYKMPTLLDLENAAVQKFGFQSIPTTVVVGPDGKIAQIHTGFSPEMVDTLKADVEAALKPEG